MRRENKQQARRLFVTVQKAVRAPGRKYEEFEAEARDMIVDTPPR
jgi:hypothetical protein